MPYTLVTTAALGFDLVRRPGGQLVAEVLLAGLTADGELLGRLAEQRSAAATETSVIASLRAREAVALKGRPCLTPGSGQATLTDWAHLLNHELLGGVHAVERLLRQEVLQPDLAEVTDADVFEAASEVLVNALLGAWAVDHIAAPVYDELVEPFFRARARAAGRAQPRDLGPAGEQLLGLLRSPLQHAPRISERWSVLASQLPGPASWVEDMHRACWAAHLSGRIRMVASAHLLAVQVFHRAGLGPPQQGGGLWNLFAGSVQATAVADPLDDRTSSALIDPWASLAS